MKMYINFRNCILISLTFYIIFLSACATTPPIREDSPLAQRGVIEDLYDYPQDLMVYAKDSHKNLLSKTAQQAQDERFNRIYFSPWQQQKASLSPNAFKNTFGSAKGYNGTIAWSENMWQNLKINADIAHYPNTARPAITTSQTNLRELPTLQPRYSKPTPNPALAPFDYFQYSALPPGMPLFITQISQDGLWYFAENPLAAGWVPSMHVAFVDEQFMTNYKKSNYAALVKDKVNLKGNQGQDLGKAYIGAIFPLVNTDKAGFDVLIPTRNNKGMANITKAKLDHNNAVKKPLPAQAMRIAKIGNEMMAQPYGWGGTNAYRDCSSTLHDLFAPFGIWLPRNSAAQYRSAATKPLQGLTLKAKEETIIKHGIPFMTFLWLPGHIGLYLGEYEGRAVMFHNIWGIRINEEDHKDNRHIIGRAVVTSLEPGLELDNVNENQTLLHRIGGMSTISGTTIRP